MVLIYYITPRNDLLQLFEYSEFNCAVFLVGFPKIDFLERIIANYESVMIQADSQKKIVVDYRLLHNFHRLISKIYYRLSDYRFLY